MEIVDRDLQSIQEVRALVAKAKKAQQEFSKFSQEDIDRVIRNMVKASEREAVKLAKMAYEETGFGKWQDKVIKNKFASKVVYDNIKNMKTIGVINDNKDKKVMEIAVPVGVIAGLIPSTNPTSTVIYKSIIALKAGNAIVFSPHPSAKGCIIETARMLNKAAVEAGAPDGIIGVMTILSMEGTDELLKHKDIGLILATGGEAMVKAAYSSGNPALGVGPGNGPAFIEKSADIPLAIKRIIDSQTFDNGLICASEQSIVVENCIKDKVVNELKKQKAYFLTKEQSEKLGKFILRSNGTMNPKIVGRSAQALAQFAGISIPEYTKVLISEQTTVSKKILIQERNLLQYSHSTVKKIGNQPVIDALNY